MSMICSECWKGLAFYLSFSIHLASFFKEVKSMSQNFTSTISNILLNGHNYWSALPTLLLCLSSRGTVRKVARIYRWHPCPGKTHTAVLLRWRFWRNVFLVFLTEARWNFQAKLFRTFLPPFPLYSWCWIQQAPIFPPLRKWSNWFH